MEVTELISELKTLKSKIKGVSSGLCCSYGSLLRNLLLMIGHFFDTIIMTPTEKEVITSQQYTRGVKSEEN